MPYGGHRTTSQHVVMSYRRPVWRCKIFGLAHTSLWNGLASLIHSLGVGVLLNARRRAACAALLSLALALDLPLSGGPGTTALTASAVAQSAAHPLTRVVVPEPARRTPPPPLANSAVRATVTVAEFRLPSVAW